MGMVGAGQVGKTTLAGMLIKQQKRSITFFDLENATFAGTMVT